MSGAPARSAIGRVNLTLRPGQARQDSRWSQPFGNLGTLRSLVDGAGAHAQLRHRRAQPRLTTAEMQAQALAGIVQRAALAHLSGTHTCTPFGS
jgi:hypothetical protein